jgi:ceramide glucosyltransferase
MLDVRCSMFGAFLLPPPALSLYEPSVLVHTLLGSLAALSLLLTLWQWLVGRRFPLHQRVPAPTLAPPVTLLKPLKGCDQSTEACLRSWFVQDYPAPVQLLFGVASADDPVCGVVRGLMHEFPACDAQLVVCGPLHGANLKVSKLAQLEPLAKFDLLAISDADVRVPPDLLANVVAPFQASAAVSRGAPAGSSDTQESAKRLECADGRFGQLALVTCFYQLANPTTLAMQWEAVAINADFWSQVLQAQSLKPLDFALGAVMVTRRQPLQDIGGFEALADCLADDYQLGHRLTRLGYRIALSPVVVECWSEPMGWAAVWKHQLRWARTIRVCQPVPYFFSVLSHATLWPLLWLAVQPGTLTLAFAAACCLTRMATALNLMALMNTTLQQAGSEEHTSLSGFSGSVGSLKTVKEVDSSPVPNVTRLKQSVNESATTASGRPAESWRLRIGWLVLLKDLLQVALWLLAFAGNRIEWRGRRLRLRRDGTLSEFGARPSNPN